MIAKKVRISGRVQGVGYRAWTVSQANFYGLKGWVRNRSDGSVEAQFQGNEEIVGAMISECRDGPMMALVNDIKIEDVTPESISHFEHRATL